MRAFDWIRGTHGSPLSSHLVNPNPIKLSHQAYAAIRAACDALVPGEGARLLDAVALETTGIYRRRYGQRPHPFGHPPVEVCVDMCTRGWV